MLKNLCFSFKWNLARMIDIVLDKVSCSISNCLVLYNILMNHACHVLVHNNSTIYWNNILMQYRYHIFEKDCSSVNLHYEHSSVCRPLHNITLFHWKDNYWHWFSYSNSCASSDSDVVRSSRVCVRRTIINQKSANYAALKKLNREFSS